MPVSREFGGSVQLRVNDLETQRGGSYNNENLVSGEVSWTLTRATDVDTVAGAFRGTWVGREGCQVPCVPVSLEGNFRSVFDF